MTDLILTLLATLVVIVILAGILAPLETLRWWGGMAAPEDAASEPLDSSTDEDSAHPHYVVYLSGIGSVSGDELVPAEVPFLRALEEAMPDARLLLDVFPYSATNNGLTGQRLLAGAFRWVSARRWEKTSVTELLINLRNAFQVAVSADERYGPVFNFATARVIRDKLLEHGYRPGRGRRVALIGYSGGAQIAIGATPFLEELIGAPVRVISLGGVMTGDNGIIDTEHLYHIYSDIDELEKFGSVAFPGRWPIYTNSGWNTALRTGKATLILLPGMTHTLAKSYMDPDTVQPDGRTNLETTVALIANLIRSDKVGEREPGSLSRAQLADLVRRVAADRPETAEAIVRLLDENGLEIQSRVAQAAIEERRS
ncbi:MAG: hypothetical protein U0556_18485 [Dehalococcoidia bacterium]